MAEAILAPRLVGGNSFYRPEERPAAAQQLLSGNLPTITAVNCP